MTLVLILKELRSASKLNVHSVNFAAKLVHTRHALSSTVINSHNIIRSRFQANPATHLIHIEFSFPFRGGGA